MKYFVAVRSEGIKDAGRFFRWEFSKTKKPVYAKVHESLEALNKPYGKDIPPDIWLGMSKNVPKENRFYDLALGTSPDALFISERVKAHLEEKKLLKGNEAVRVGLRDPKGRPIEQPVYMLRQLATPACIDEEKSSGTRWDTGDPGYMDMDRFSLDLEKIPKGVHLFRSSQFPQILFMTEELVRGFVEAGFAGLDYTTPEKWRDDEFKLKISLKGPLPAAAHAPSKPAGKKPAREVPGPLKPFLKAHRGKWIAIDIKKGIFVGPVMAFVFDWDALAPAERKALEEGFLFESPLEEPEYVPFAVLHIDFEALTEEVGKKPKSLSDALAIQTAGLLVSDAEGRVIYLESGSRTDIASSPERLKIKPAGSRKT